MLRCLVNGTESMPGARAQEAGRPISLFLGDLCVVAMASEDRRSFGPFAVDSRNEQMTTMMRQAVEGAPRERGAWPLAGGALISGEPVMIDRIRPGELVADEETLELLAELGVDLAQGFHVGRPRPLAEV
jgi:hypothetical protein